MIYYQISEGSYAVIIEYFTCYNGVKVHSIEADLVPITFGGPIPQLLHACMITNAL